MWAVVQFIETEEVEVLPLKWISDGVAKYPPYSKANLEKAIKCQEAPKEDWQLFNVKFMTKKTFNNFNLASKKASLACLTSDLEDTTDGELPMKREVKKKVLSSSSSSSSENDLDFPTPPKNLATSVKSVQDRRSKPKESTKHQSSCFSQSQPHFVGDTTNSVKSVQDSKPKESTSQPHIVGETTNGKRSSVPDKGINKAVYIKDQSFSEPNFGGETTDDCFKRKVISFLVKIKKGVRTTEKAIEEIEKKLENIENQLKQKVTVVENQQDDATLDLYSLFPINEEDKLNNCERELVNDQVFKMLVGNLRKIGGNNLTDSTNRILKKMFTDEIMQLYSRSGHKGKKPFEKTKFFEALTETLQVGKNPPTLKEIEGKTSIYLSKAKERMKKKEKINNDH